MFQISGNLTTDIFHSAYYSSHIFSQISWNHVFPFSGLDIDILLVRQNKIHCHKEKKLFSRVEFILLLLYTHSNTPLNGGIGNIVFYLLDISLNLSVRSVCYYMSTCISLAGTVCWREIYRSIFWACLRLLRICEHIGSKLSSKISCLFKCVCIIKLFNKKLIWSSWQFFYYCIFRLLWIKWTYSLLNYYVSCFKEMKVLTRGFSRLPFSHINIIFTCFAIVYSVILCSSGFIKIFDYWITINNLWSGRSKLMKSVAYVK